MKRLGFKGVLAGRVMRDIRASRRGILGVGVVVLISD